MTRYIRIAIEIIQAFSNLAVRMETGQAREVLYYNRTVNALKCTHIYLYLFVDSVKKSHKMEAKNESFTRALYTYLTISSRIGRLKNTGPSTFAYTRKYEYITFVKYREIAR